VYSVYFVAILLLFLKEITPMSERETSELLALNQKLLDSIASADWTAYQELCDPSMTAFEPEALGQLIEGLEFHHFYFKLSGFRGSQQTTMCNPKVRLIGDVAVITYIRLRQRTSPEGGAICTGSAETRIWQRKAGSWKHVHFHRSPLVDGKA
jgi:calcium/calmodulin-dependent protein kinase (CaM kinase) II